MNAAAQNAAIGGEEKEGKEAKEAKDTAEKQEKPVVKEFKGQRQRWTEDEDDQLLDA